MSCEKIFKSETPYSGRFTFLGTAYMRGANIESLYKRRQSKNYVFEHSQTSTKGRRAHFSRCWLYENNSSYNTLQHEIDLIYTSIKDKNVCLNLRLLDLVMSFLCLFEIYGKSWVRKLDGVAIKTFYAFKFVHKNLFKKA